MTINNFSICIHNNIYGKKKHRAAKPHWDKWSTNGSVAFGKYILVATWTLQWNWFLAPPRRQAYIETMLHTQWEWGEAAAGAVAADDDANPGKRLNLFSSSCCHHTSYHICIKWLFGKVEFFFCRIVVLCTLLLCGGVR